MLCPESKEQAVSGPHFADKTCPHRTGIPVSHIYKIFSCTGSLLVVNVHKSCKKVALKYPGLLLNYQMDWGHHTHNYFCAQELGFS